MTGRRDEALLIWLVADPDDPYCAASAMDRWHAAIGAACGPAARDEADCPVFVPLDRNYRTAMGYSSGRGITGDAMNDIIRRRAAEAGIDPRAFTSYSWRAGYVTEALDANVPIAQIMAVTGHRCPETVLIYQCRSPEMKRETSRKIQLMRRNRER